MSSAEFPSEIITDTDTKEVTITPEIAAALPGVERAFAAADKAFLSNPEKYLQNLEASLFEFRSSQGSEVACSFLYGPDSRSDELLIIFAPFADRPPKSRADQMYEYITADTPGGIISKEKYAPNSWNQTTKSAVIFDLLEALGKKIPVLTIYGPVPSHAYSFKERSRFRNGDFSPAGRLAKEAVAEVQDLLHGSKSETQISRLYLSGASLGASNAIGAAASKELSSRFVIPSVTAQELIMGPRNLKDLGDRFIRSQYIGEPSREAVSSIYPAVEEPAIRKAIDRHGSEPIGTSARVVKGMKPTYMLGLNKPIATVQAIERMLDNNVGLLVALAENSSLTHETAGYLPNEGEGLITIRGEHGQKIGHLADEHVALSALIATLNLIKKS